MRTQKYNKCQILKYSSYGDINICKTIDRLLWQDPEQQTFTSISSSKFIYGIDKCIKYICKYNDVCKQIMNIQIPTMNSMVNILITFKVQIKTNEKQRSIFLYNFKTDKNMIDRIFNTDYRKRTFRVHRILNVITKISKILQTKSKIQYYCEFTSYIKVMIKKQYFYSMFQYIQSLKHINDVIIPWDVPKKQKGLEKCEIPVKCVKNNSHMSTQQTLNKSKVQLLYIDNSGIYHYKFEGIIYFVNPRYSEAPPSFYKRHPEELKQNNEYQKRLIITKSYS